MSSDLPKPHDSSTAPAVITLTTDFGTADTYATQMKGVIAGISPQARVIDGTHGIPPQNILAAAVALDSMVEAFEDGAIHVTVVDPGVGSDRAAVAIETSGFTLVGPDNGVFTLVLDRYPPTAIIRLTDPAYHREPVSATFHGRDIFAPVAAHLANGTAIEQLGEPVSTLVNLNIPQPSETPDGLTAVVMMADRFGNLVTNLTRDRYDAWLAGNNAVSATVNIKRKKLGPILRTYADVQPGEPVAYFGSSGRLEIAVRDGSAGEVFGFAGKVVVSAHHS
jgi:S-adenosylmethionine hydrolase